MNGLLDARLIAAACLGVALVVVVLLLVAKSKQARALTSRLAETDAQARAALERMSQQLARYQPLIDAEAELARIRHEAATLHGQVETTRWAAHAEVQSLQTRIAELRRELGILEAEAYFQSYGLYSSKYDFESSAQYKQRLDWIREQQKQLVKDGHAAICRTEWIVGGSEKDGKKMANDALKLMLRAFNGECDAAIAKVKHNNFAALAERIQKAFEALNKLGSVNTCELTHRYMGLKMEELTLFHEYQQKIQDEREEQRAIQEQIREEKKAVEEMERAKRKAEEEEARYADALEKARADVERTTGAKHDRLMRQIAELEGRLAEAQENKRTISLAEQTRAGHVYVISNVGSFGEDVYKIGMTRRLDPMDRIRELGDASVPFPFDVHAVISTTDAPKLENELHRMFAARRLNAVNLRKEFFAVGLAEIEAAVHRHHGTIEFTKLAEATEWRTSVATREQQKARPVESASVVSAPPLAVAG